MYILEKQFNVVKEINIIYLDFDSTLKISLMIFNF